MTTHPLAGVLLCLIQEPGGSRRFVDQLHAGIRHNKYMAEIELSLLLGLYRRNAKHAHVCSMTWGRVKTACVDRR
jgi:hypothetical protein